MAPVEDRNVRTVFLTSCLAVIFGLKLITILQNGVFNFEVTINIKEQHMKSLFCFSECGK